MSEGKPPFDTRPRPRNNVKFFLTGRTVRIDWATVEADSGVYLCIFHGDGWLRLKDVKSGKEFATPVVNVWRVTDVD
jgi:hypothetical protein